MTLGADYFAGIYAAADDPWGLASRWYERRKYALTVAALPEGALRQRARSRLLYRRPHRATGRTL